MTAPTIRVGYDDLGRIGRMFAEQAAACGQMTASLRAAMGALEGGGWIGAGATAFYREMSGEVFPALGRLVQALELGAATTLRIGGVIRQAEADAASVLRGLPGPGASAVDVAKTPSPGGPIPIPYPNIGGAVAPGGTIRIGPGALFNALTPAGAGAALGAVARAAFDAGLVTPVRPGDANIGDLLSQAFRMREQDQRNDQQDARLVASVAGPAAAALGSGLLGALQGAASAAFEGVAGAAGEVARAVFNDTGASFEDRVAIFLTRAMAGSEAHLSDMMGDALRVADSDEARARLGNAERQAASDGRIAAFESSGLGGLVDFARASLDSGLVAQASNTLRGGVQALRGLSDLAASEGREAVASRLDELGEVSQETSMRLQLAMDHFSRSTELISNLMKRWHDTAQGIIQNIK